MHSIAQFDLSRRREKPGSFSARSTFFGDSEKLRVGITVSLYNLRKNSDFDLVLKGRGFRAVSAAKSIAALSRCGLHSGNPTDSTSSLAIPRILRNQMPD